MGSTFVHLHTHSDYSLLDGMIRIPDLVSLAAKDEQPAMAITDHGNLCGVIEFYKACRQAGIKPILGTGAWLAPKSRLDRERNPVAGHQLNLLATSETGYRNLIKLSTKSFTEGFYHFPRLDLELLASHREGLIALSGCQIGEPAYYAYRNDPDRARHAVGRMRDLFGDDYYIEIQRNGAAGEREISETLLQLARDEKVPLVATRGIAYASPDHAHANTIHRCIRWNYTLNSNNLRDRGDVSFCTRDAMMNTFKDLPDALQATVDIANRCDVELPQGMHLPRFVPPEGHDERSYFMKLCKEGAHKRYGETLSDAVTERLAMEQRVIENMGYIAYFLITWDFVDYARRNNIPVGPGRGSAAGSIVAYCLGITNVDPLAYDLIFERFLNPDRVSLPDIDIDFCKDGREKVIRYVQEKYGGAECVSQIITFGRMAARAVVRDIGRVMEVQLSDVDRLAKRIPNGPGDTLRGALEGDADLRSMIAENKQFSELMDAAKVLEGMKRHAGKHAAGVVVSDGPLEQYAPLYRVGDDYATQWSMDLLEDPHVGLLKMDFLGLRTLTIIAKAVEYIRRDGLVVLEPDDIPLDDAPTFEMLSRGDALGVFQVEGSGMRSILKQIRPSVFEDLSTVLALYRPGPMNSGMMDMYIERKNGRAPVTYPHPSLEPVLKESYGVVVYQDQVMQIAGILADFPMSDADNLRKAMGKKKPEILAKFNEKFLEGCERISNVPRDEAQVIWDQLAEFAAYGFNKAHTVAYGLITYQTAYLKRHFPRQYMAALLTCEMGDMDKLTQYIGEARRMGIDVLPPNINRSNEDFAVEGENIRYGLAAIKSVGRSAATAIRTSRPNEGYASIFDLCERVDPGRANRSTLEALNRAGAFDETGATRAQIAVVIPRALSLGSTAAEDRASGQFNLFAEPSEDARPPEATYPDTPPWSPKDKMQWERESIGYYATNHPLAQHERKLRTIVQRNTTDLTESMSRQEVRLGGMIRELRTMTVSRGKNAGRRMAAFNLEDFMGTVECVCFADTFAKLEPILQEDLVVVLEGRINTSRDEISVGVDSLVPIEEAGRSYARGLLIELQTTEDETLDRLESVLTAHAGPLPVVLQFQPTANRVACVRAGATWSVQADLGLLEAIENAVPSVSSARYLSRDP